MRSPIQADMPLLRRVLERSTRPPVLTVFAVLQLTLVLVVSAGQIGSRLAPAGGAAPEPIGDFTAFYTGASLIHDGRGGQLYDFSAQKDLQERILGEELTDWQPYLNPPGLAFLLAWTAGMGYAVSFLVFTLGQALILLSALLYLRLAAPRLSESRTSAITAVLLTMGFLPLALTTFGGQNTPISFALLAGIYAGTRLGHRTVAGMLLGLLTFKPQYAVAAGILLLFRKEWRVLLFGVLVGVAHYGIGAVFSGADWPLAYLAAMSSHRPLEVAANAPWHFSIPMVVRRALPGLPGLGLTLLGAGAVLVVTVASGRRVKTGSGRYPAWFGLAVCAVLLASPHLQYYESGILALPILLGIESVAEERRQIPLALRISLAVAYFAFPTWHWSRELGVQPLFLLLLGAWVWLSRLSHRRPATG